MPLSESTISKRLVHNGRFTMPFEDLHQYNGCWVKVTIELEAVTTSRAIEMQEEIERLELQVLSKCSE